VEFREVLPFSRQSLQLVAVVAVANICKMVAVVEALVVVVEHKETAAVAVALRGKDTLAEMQVRAITLLGVVAVLAVLVATFQVLMAVLAVLQLHLVFLDQA
jgi:hypothetical protein